MCRPLLVRRSTIVWITAVVSLALIDHAAGAKRPAHRTPRVAYPIDINRASAEELKTLPGIEDAYAASIKRNRPYQNKAQLLSRKVIPESTYARIKKRIIAKQ